MKKFLIISFLIFVGCMSDDIQTESHPEEESIELSVNNLEESTISDQVNNGGNFGFVNTLLEFTKWILSTILVIFIIVVLYFLYRNYRKRIRKLKVEISNLNERIDDLERAKNKDKRELLEYFKKDIYLKFYKKLELLHSEIDSIKNSINTSSRADYQNLVSREEDYAKVRSDEKQTESNITEPLLITKFFTVPNEDGRFENQRAVETSAGNMIYFKISHEDGSSIGKLDYNQGRLDQSAIDKRDSILKPVCNIKNPEIVKPTKIHQLNPGEVELNDGFWRVRKKVQIEFI